MLTIERTSAIDSIDVQRVHTDVMKKSSTRLPDFIDKYLNNDSKTNYEIDSSDPVFIELIKSGTTCNVINYCKINDIRYINKYFEAVNRKLQIDDTFICCIESKSHRAERILARFNPIISYPLCFIDFLLHRVVPKVPFLKKIYFFLTKGRNRVLSLSEGLGRLISCGFDINEFKTFSSITYIVTTKKRMPYYDTNPTYGMLVQLNRVGKAGKLIKVYKMRTMHPYSEYLQDYMYKNNDLRDGGKFNDDYRITSYGKLFRKLWIDELPMLYNFIKGDLKLVGVRPLSQHYFSLYPKDVQELRIKSKPGLVPPFYADMPKSLDDIVESEQRYLQAYEIAPIRTDIRYFFVSFYNIFFRGARSA